MTAPTLTDTEVRVLRECWGDLGYIIANPPAGIRHLRDSHSHSGGRGWQRWIGENRINVEQHEFIPDVIRECRPGCDDGEFFHTPGGEHIERWRYGALLFEGSITLPRVQQWAESLPAELRARALVAWRTHPENTRDLAELNRITREAVDLHCGPCELESNQPQELVGQGVLW